MQWYRNVSIKVFHCIFLWFKTQLGQLMSLHTCWTTASLCQMSSVLSLTMGRTVISTSKPRVLLERELRMGPWIWLRQTFVHTNWLSHSFHFSTLLKETRMSQSQSASLANHISPPSSGKLELLRPYFTFRSWKSIFNIKQILYPGFW